MAPQNCRCLHCELQALKPLRPLPQGGSAVMASRTVQPKLQMSASMPGVNRLLKSDSPFFFGFTAKSRGTACQ